MKQIYLFILFCILTFVSFGQRPRKIYSLLSEKMYPEALHELNKFDSQKKYDKDDLILFEIAKSLLMIEKGVGMYNPIKSIQTFNNISIPPEYKEDIDVFLNKYQLDLNKISILINSELVAEAKLTNSIEAYSKALTFCSISHKFELQNLLERRTLNDAKESKSISKLNNFITNYSNSSFKIEAIDFRDSLVLLKTPYLYDSLLLFTKIYPNSKFTFNLNNQLADCLFDEVYKTNSKDAYERFFTLFPLDKRVDTLRKKILSLRYFESKIINKNQSIDLQYSIQLFKNGIAKVFDYSNKENRYPREGLINLKKEINKVTFYEQISDFRYGVSIVSNYGLYGLINSEGEIILPLKFNKLEIDSLGLIKAGINNLYGVYDTTGSTVLSVKYDILEVTKLGMIIVGINNLYGAYNHRGESIIPMIYESLVYVSNYGFFAKLNGLNGLLNEKGILTIPISYHDFYIIAQNRIHAKCNNLFGIINREGKVIIPFDFGEIEIDNNFFLREEGTAFNKTTTLFNIDGKFITKVPYEFHSFRDNLFEVSNNEAYFGYLDTNGREVIPLKYACSECGCYTNNNINPVSKEVRFFFVCKKYNNKLSPSVGLLDNKLKKYIIPIIYDRLIYRSDNLIEAELNGLKGVFDYNGKLIIPLIYDKFNYIENGYLLAFIKNKGYLYNKNGGLIISNLDCIYNDSGDLYTDYTIVNHKQQAFIITRINGKYGVINEKGKFILPMQYENIKFCNLSNPLFIAECFDEYTVFFDLNGKVIKKDKIGSESIQIFKELNLIKVGLLNSGCGLYDSYGKVVVPCIYSNINFLQTNTSNVKEGYLLVEQDALVKKDSFKYEIKEKMGLLDNKGNVIFRPIYDNITLTNNKAIVNINNKKGLFDLNNNMILPISYDYLSEISNGLLIGRKENEFYLIELNEKFLKL